MQNVKIFIKLLNFMIETIKNSDNEVFVTVSATCDTCGLNTIVYGEHVMFAINNLLISNLSRIAALKISYSSALVKAEKAHKMHNPNCNRLAKCSWYK